MRRILILILCVLAVARAVEWHLDRASIETEHALLGPEDFLLGTGSQIGITIQSDPENVPLFRPSDSAWLVQGEVQYELMPYMEGFEVGPHGSEPFLTIRLHEGASVNDYRRAISSLAQAGICRVAVLSPSPAAELASPQYQLREGEAEVYQVLRYKPDFLPPRTCMDRFPRWPQ